MAHSYFFSRRAPTGTQTDHAYIVSRRQRPWCTTGRHSWGFRNLCEEPLSWTGNYEPSQTKKSNTGLEIRETGFRQKKDHLEGKDHGEYERELR